MARGRNFNATGLTRMRPGGPFDRVNSGRVEKRFRKQCPDHDQALLKQKGFNCRDIRPTSRSTLRSSKLPIIREEEPQFTSRTWIVKNDLSGNAKWDTGEELIPNTRENPIAVKSQNCLNPHTRQFLTEDSSMRFFRKALSNLPSCLSIPRLQIILVAGIEDRRVTYQP
jgi:hypothetical protein